MRYGHEFTAYVMAALGLKRGDHLPLDGIAPRVVEIPAPMPVDSTGRAISLARHAAEGALHGHRAIAVWVMPAPRLAPQANRYGRLFKSAKHRLMAQCPECGKAVSVGRLNQHVCGSKHAATLPDASHFTNK